MSTSVQGHYGTYRYERRSMLLGICQCVLLFLLNVLFSRWSPNSRVFRSLKSIILYWEVGGEGQDFWMLYFYCNIWARWPNITLSNFPFSSEILLGGNDTIYRILHTDTWHAILSHMSLRHTIDWGGTRNIVLDHDWNFASILQASRIKSVIYSIVFGMGRVCKIE